MTETETENTQQVSDTFQVSWGFDRIEKKWCTERYMGWGRQKLAIEELQRKHCCQGTTRLPLEQEVGKKHIQTELEFQSVS